MFEKLFSYRQIGELETDYRLKSAVASDREKRANVPIAIIDDEPFTPQQTLTNHGYDIRAIGDLKSLSEIDQFNIILCDLRGVGRHFDAKNQGAYLIDEIKRNHPEKFVIAYTGGAQDDSMSLRANQAADSFIRKDADVEEWRDKLDDFIDRIWNPTIVWRRQRDALVHHNVATLDILRIEDAFVRAVLIGSPDSFKNKVAALDLRGDARSIVQSLIASGIFYLIAQG